MPVSHLAPIFCNASESTRVFRLTNTPHTSTDFEHQLNEAHDRVLQMGGRVERQVVDAIESLGSGSEALIDQIMQHETVINALEVEIDALVGQIIARRQPTARDLRMLMAIIKTTTHLERVGDEAKKIALHARRGCPARRQVLPRYVEIRRISKMVLAMLRTSLSAFEQMQVAGAAERGGQGSRRGRRVPRRAAPVDHVHDRGPAHDLGGAGYRVRRKSLERIGDHAKNIAEQVIYAVDGRDVRHASDPGR